MTRDLCVSCNENVMGMNGLCDSCQASRTQRVLAKINENKSGSETQSARNNTSPINGSEREESDVGNVPDAPYADDGDEDDDWSDANDVVQEEQSESVESEQEAEAENNVQTSLVEW